MYDYHNFHRLDHIFHISWYCYRMILLLILIELPSHTAVVIEVIHYLEFIFSLFNRKLNLEVDLKFPTYTVNVWLSQLFYWFGQIFHIFDIVIDIEWTTLAYCRCNHLIHGRCLCTYLLVYVDFLTFYIFVNIPF